MIMLTKSNNKLVYDKAQIKAPLAIFAIITGWYFSQKVRVPKHVSPVDDFLVEKYLGKWYEIGRIDFMFERELISCMADYGIGNNGTIRVVNRGFDPEKRIWKSANAIAKFIDKKNYGALKVSFFKPFYSGYFIVHIDDEYKNAVVVGDKSNYCWILSRTPEMDDTLYNELLCVAATNGVDIKKMHRVEQTGTQDNDHS